MRQYLFYNRTLHFIITFGIHSLSNNEETSMGKNGKARKRQKIEQEIRKYGELANESDDSNAEEEDGPQLAGLSPLEVEALLQVLKSFSRRLDLYEDKACKPLRIAIFPLIEIQQSKFFEDVAKPVPLTDEEFHASLSASLVAKASNAISYLIRNTEEFASEQYKHIRRALHPLVVHTNRKLKAGKATAQLSASVRSATTTAGSAALSSLSEDLATTNGQSNSSSSSSSSSLSNRISNCFRSGDHVGAQRALEALHRLCTSATTSETERSAALPKLGQFHFISLVFTVVSFFVFVELSLLFVTLFLHEPPFLLLSYLRTLRT